MSGSRSATGRDRKIFVVGSKTLIETQQIYDDEGDHQLIILARCASCSGVLHNVQEIAALCSVCDGELCRACVKQCCICSQALCSQHAQQLSDTKVCCAGRHGFFRRLSEALSS